LSGLDAHEHKKALQYTFLKNINYNPWGSITGRLTTKPNSFPILTLPRSLRPALEPTNDLFVELDYNSAEMRTAIALAGAPQPPGDIHDHLKSEVFGDKYTRDQVKQKVFAWLYNPKSNNKKMQQFLDRDALLEQYYDGAQVMTPFDRSIAVGESKALNYLVQSTASDLFLTQAMKIFSMLRSRRSHIAFCVHDSLVIDMSREDQPILEEVLSTFSETPLGEYKANVSIGKNFGHMRKIQ
jgi:hypothetical protein